MLNTISNYTLHFLLEFTFFSMFFPLFLLVPYFQREKGWSGLKEEQGKGEKRNYSRKLIQETPGGFFCGSPGQADFPPSSQFMNADLASFGSSQICSAKDHSCPGKWQLPLLWFDDRTHGPLLHRIRRPLCLHQDTPRALLFFLEKFHK